MTASTYKHLTPYTRPSNYIGATWFGYYDIAGMHRDSDLLTQSNFACWGKFLTELLGPSDMVVGEESFEQDSAFPADDTRGDDIFNWTVCEESHWAVGWVKVIRVHESVGHDKLAAIDAQLHRLDGYPVMDEDHFSQLEDDEHRRVWASDCKRIWHDWLESRIGEKPYELLMSVYPEEIECVLNRAFENECMNTGETWAEPAKDYTIGELREDADCGHYGDRYVRLFENLTAAEAANLSDE